MIGQAFPVPWEALLALHEAEARTRIGQDFLLPWEVLLDVDSHATTCQDSPRQWEARLDVHAQLAPGQLVDERAHSM